jgi:hypothetical protein
MYWEKEKMKIISLKKLSVSCLILGWLTALMALLDGLEILPDIIHLELWGTDDIASIIFWVGLSMLLVLTAVALGVIADKK